MKSDNIFGGIYMNGSVKIFGFRSGKSYKMIPALLYYAFMAFFIGASVYGELRYYKFEPMDYVLMAYKYIFFAILFFSPLIFLSDFKYREKLPLFKKRTAVSSLIGIMIVWMFCYFMAQVNVLCMSDTWVESRDAYTKQLKEEQEKALKEQMSEEKETQETKEETTKEISYNSEKNIVYVLKC